MAKAFGLFPTIYQEYSKKQVDSKYLFSIDIMVSYINNECTYSTNLYTHISANFHSQDSFPLLTTIIQFTFVQHNILSSFTILKKCEVVISPFMYLSHAV